MRNRPPTRRRGAVVVLAALLLGVIFSMVAFAVDVGYIVHARTEIQRTADACALGAAWKLPDKAAAINYAQQIAVQNRASVGPALAAQDVLFGYWDRKTATFWDPPPSGRSTNAVKVTLRRTQASGNPLRLFFGRAIGTSWADVEATATAVCDRGVCGPFIGVDWLNVAGDPQTDSYSTFEGFYDEQTPTQHGSVCSDGPVDIEGNPIIAGDALAGHDDEVILDGTPIVTGAIGNRLRPLNMPIPDASKVKLDNNNSNAPPVEEGGGWKSVIDAEGNFLLDGNKVYNLPPGSYCFNDFTLAGQCVFNVNGKTIIYILGDMYRGGGVTVNNNTQDPNNLQIYMTGGTANITSSNPFHGVIYAPNTPILLAGDSHFYGACVGKTLTITGTSFGHYDTELELEEVQLPLRTALVDGGLEYDTGG